MILNNEQLREQVAKTRYSHRQRDRIDGINALLASHVELAEQNAELLAAAEREQKRMDDAIFRSLTAEERVAAQAERIKELERTVKWMEDEEP